MADARLPTEDRQVLATALALLVHLRPGWTSAVAEVAERLDLTALVARSLLVVAEPAPLRLYRWEDAPPGLRALSHLGGNEWLLLVAPAPWLEEGGLAALPHVLWLLLAADTRTEWPTIEGTWGAVQRVPLDDGSWAVIVARP